MPLILFARSGLPDPVERMLITGDVLRINIRLSDEGIAINTIGQHLLESNRKPDCCGPT